LRLPQRLYPAIALLLFQRRRHALPTGHLRTRPPLFSPAPRNGVRRSEPRAACQGPGAAHLVFGPRHIAFGGVLHEKDEGLLFDPFPRGIDVRSKHLRKSHSIVVKESICCGRLRVTATSARNAGRRVLGELVEYLLQSLIQASIAERCRAHFLANPWRQHWSIL